MNPALKILEKKALGRLRKDKRNTNAENPYLERVPVVKNGKIVKYKSQERPLPQGLTDEEGKILRRVRKRAYRWDMGFTCCCFGLKFGWSSIIGLLPVIGDFADFLMALTLIKTAAGIKGGLPKRLYSQMFTNILIDFAAGFVPIIGDVIDVFYRANTRNAWLLDAYLTEVAKARREGLTDPDTEAKVNLPDELKMGPGDRDVEAGVEPSRVVQPIPRTPAPVAHPQRTPSRPTPPPTGNMGSSRPSIVPVRSLTSQRTIGLPGRQIRQVQDPRDGRRK